jgi:glycerol-3-phosphate acyltransferase PlsY
MIQTDITYLGIVFLCGYLLGSIPFGLLLVKLTGGGDIRQIGSGNIGATNVLRTGNKPLALATLLLDAGKGAAAVLLARHFQLNELLAGAAAFLGHLYPVWLRFKGGKGVATMLGLYLAWAWPAGLTACLAWLLIAVIFRFSSLAALVAAIVAPVFIYLVLHDTCLSEVTAMIGALVFLRHRANIQRLLRGTEPKIGRKNADAKSA